MDQSKLDAIVEAVVRELLASGAVAAANDPPPVSGRPSVVASPPSAVSGQPSAVGGRSSAVVIDLPDPAAPDLRYAPNIRDSRDPEGLRALIASTTARIGVGRAGPRYRTNSLLLFQADHAITQDALMRDVDQGLLDEMGLFTVQTRVTGGKQEYLLRPDLGRQLNDEARRLVAERCARGANVQVVAGDGLSAAAIEANLRQIFPVIQQGCQAAGLSFGAPFFIKYCRVGVLNDIGDLLGPDVVILLIGERPGLGRADSMSAYMAYRPKAGDTDADRDVVCNIFENGGANPLEAGAYVVQLVRRMRQAGASGVKLRLARE